MELSERQLKIIDIVKKNEPVTGEEIARHLDLARATLRPDLSILTMSKILYAKPKVGYFFGDVSGIGLSFNTIKETEVSDFMSVSVCTRESESIHSAIVQMFLEDVGTLFITEGGILTGLVSRKDLLKCSIGGMDIEKLPVTMAMTRVPNVVFVKKEDPVGLAVHKIFIHEVDCLPVVEEIEGEENQYKVVGRFSKTNVTAVLMKMLEG